MRTPDFDILLERYMESSRELIRHAPYGPISAEDITGFERREGIPLPPDYALLLQRWDLTAIEINFTTFYPPFAETQGVVEAIGWGRHSADAPFAEQYRKWQALPVGEDFMQLQLIMSVQESPEILGHAAEAERSLRLYPHGSIWAFDAEAREVSARFVSSTFTQALHTALFLWSVRDALKSRAIEAVDARSVIVTIDGAIEQSDYWRLWIEVMSR